MQALLTKLMEFAATEAGLLTAVAVLACLLGAEIAGICILIAKMLRARRQRYEEDEGDGSLNAGVLAPVLLSVLPQGSLAMVGALAGLTALLAVAFLILLIVFRACGYDFASSRRKTAVQDEPVEDTWTPVSAPVAEEEQEQEQFTPPAQPYISPVAAADAEDVQSAPAEEVEDIEEESPVYVTVEQPAPAPVTVAPAAEEGAAVQTQTIYNENGQPVRIVEKVVKETVKEIYKEETTTAPAPAAPAAPATPAASMPTTEEIAEAVAEKLRQRDAADAEKKVTSGETVATFAQSGRVEELAEDEEDDEDELDETEDKDRDEDDDVDDEDNEIADDRFTGSERIIGFDEETGCYIVAHYRKSFEAKLIQSRANIKHYYSELKNALLSYGGTKSRISWAADSFSNERTPIAKINVKTRTLEIYLALDPESLADSIYKGTDVGHKKKYADTPFRYKIRSPRKLKWALELVHRTCEEQGLSPIDIEPVDYEAQYPFETTETLVDRRLIKEYIRQEKPATTFELAPDHVPEVPDEDGSVIPANANFTWEFDNEVMEEKAEEPEIVEEVQDEPADEPTEQAPVEETVPEPAPAPAPAAEPAAPTSNKVYRETVKVTEMRYTEHYYGNGKPAEGLPPVTAEFEELLPETATETATVTETAEGLTETVETEVAETEVLEDGQSYQAEEMPTDAEEVYETEETEQAEAAPVEPFGVYDDLDELPDEIANQLPEEEYTEQADAAAYAAYAEEQTADAQYAEEEYARQYAEGRYDDQAYAEQYADEQYEQGAYAEQYEGEQYEGEQYDEAQYEEAQYTEEQYNEAQYAEAQYDDGQYAEDGYEDGTYDGAEYAEDGQYAEDAAYAQGAHIVNAEPVEADEPERPGIAANPTVALVDLCTVEAYFPAGAVVSVETLKAKELILPTVTRLKVYASGALTKSLTVEANHFTLDAIQAITEADGDSVMVR